MTGIKDDMVNNWGCELIIEEGKFQRVRSTHTSFDCFIRKTVPGFTLKSIEKSGSGANGVAMELASGSRDSSRCLIGMGSYVAGSGRELQEMSTAKFDTNQYLNLVQEPDDDLHGLCKLQTIALPYFVQHELLPARTLEKT